MSDPATDSPGGYRPREFWQERLSEHFDLRGTGHPGLSAAYNERCYRLRGFVLDAVLARHHVPVAGREVLDAGCGTGFFVQHFLARGARVTGVDLTEVSARRLAGRFPTATFEVGDLADWRPRASYDVVSCFDVLFHITDDQRWDHALDHLVEAVAPGGWFVFTEHFPRHPAPWAEHNVFRGRDAYRAALTARGLAWVDERPTHHLMNAELGAFRFLNRFPELLYRIDLGLLATGLLDDRGMNRLVLCRRTSADHPLPRD